MLFIQRKEKEIERERVHWHLVRINLQEQTTNQELFHLRNTLIPIEIQLLVFRRGREREHGHDFSKEVSFNFFSHTSTRSDIISLNEVNLQWFEGRKIRKHTKKYYASTCIFCPNKSYLLTTMCYTDWKLFFDTHLRIDFKLMNAKYTNIFRIKCQFISLQFEK